MLYETSAVWEFPNFLKFHAKLAWYLAKTCKKFKQFQPGRFKNRSLELCECLKIRGHELDVMNCDRFG